MTGINPNYSDWRELPAISIWKIAALMQGFDPRAVEAGDVVVRDPFDPLNTYGVAPDLSWEIEVLITSVQTGDLATAPANIIELTEQTKVTLKSLVPWLRLQGQKYASFADELASSWTVSSPTLPDTVVQLESTLPDPQRLRGDFLSEPLKVQSVIDLSPLEWDDAQPYPLPRNDVEVSPGAPPKVTSAVIAADPPAVGTLGKEMSHEKNKGRWQMCVDAGLEMPASDYEHLPRGIGVLAKKEGISQQAFSKSVKMHIARKR